MATRPTKKRLIEELIREFRVSGNEDSAFDGLAAERLGVNRTDLHCLNIIENSSGVTAGELAAQAGLTTGAVTGVIDRLEGVGYARRMPDSADRRRVKIEVTPEFYRRAEGIWGPMAADWQSTLAGRFSVAELERITEFLRATNEVAARHLDRIRET
jgi:DNA-binding MarR family transcriptional regulator